MAGRLTLDHRLMHLYTDYYVKDQMRANARVASFGLDEAQVRVYQERVQGVHDRLEALLRSRNKYSARCYR